MCQAQECLKVSTIRGQQGRPGPGQRLAPGADCQQRLGRDLCPPRPSLLSDLIEDSLEFRPCLLALGARADDHGLACQPRGAKCPPGRPATAEQLPATGDEQPCDRQVSDQVAGELVARAPGTSGPGRPQQPVRPPRGQRRDIRALARVAKQQPAPGQGDQRLLPCVWGRPARLPHLFVPH